MTILRFAAMRWLALLSLLAMAVFAGCSSSSGGSGASSAASTAAGGTSGTIKVGILHSLSGTMAISEVSVKRRRADGDRGDQRGRRRDGQAARAGDRGRRVGLADVRREGQEADPEDKVATVFGCWTSASRKAVLPVFERTRACSATRCSTKDWRPRRTSSTPAPRPTSRSSRRRVPAQGEKKNKFFLLGSDYVFPRTANKIIKAQLEASGGQTVGEEYTPLGHTDYSTVISKIKAANPDVVFNTLNGDSNVAFFKQLKDAGHRPPTRCRRSRSASPRKRSAASAPRTWSAT